MAAAYPRPITSLTLCLMLHLASISLASATELDGAWLGMVRPAPRRDGAGAYDAVHRRALFVGGLTTDYPENLPTMEVWSPSDAPFGHGWEAVQTAGPQPPARYSFALVEDTPRSRLLIIGGTDGVQNYDDVWALNLAGTPTWELLAVTGPRPRARFDHTAILDLSTDDVFLFGGIAGADTLGDTWRLDLSGGMTWSQVEVSGGSPSARSGHTWTYAPSSQQALLIGGARGTSWSSEVWAFTTGPVPTWSLLTPVGAGPGPLALHSADLDPAGNRIILYGGFNGSTQSSSVWSLTPGLTPTWALISPAGSSRPQKSSHLSSRDPALRRTYYFGGTSDLEVLSLASAPTWSRQSYSLGSNIPSPLADGTLIHDPVHHRLIMFGGFSGSTRRDVWQLPLAQPSLWSRVPQTPVWPAAMVGHAAVYDALRQRMIMVGVGSGAPQVWALTLDNSWVWSRLDDLVTQAPSSRSNYSLVYDPVRDRVVLFGGYDGSGRRNDAWEFSFSRGGEWRLLVPVPGPTPPGRSSHTAVYDPLADRMLVFGGDSSADFLNDTWALEFASGTPTWRQIVPTTPLPPTRREHAAMFDPLASRMIVYGGRVDGHLERHRDVWALTLGAASAQWQPLLPRDGVPQQRDAVAYCYDSIADRFVIFGGEDGTRNYTELINLTWGRSLNVDLSSPAVDPSRGGNTGFVTVDISGLPLPLSGVTGVRLEGVGAPIAADTVFARTHETVLRARLDLRGAVLGTRDVVVLAGASEVARLDSAFAVEPGLPANLKVEVRGSSAIRAGLSTPLVVAVTNLGNTDIRGVPVSVFGLPPAGEVLLSSPVLGVQATVNDSLMDLTQELTLLGDADSSIAAVLIPLVRVGEEYSCHFDLRPLTAGKTYRITAEAGLPLVIGEWAPVEGQGLLGAVTASGDWTPSRESCQGVDAEFMKEVIKEVGPSILAGWAGQLAGELAECMVELVNEQLQWAMDIMEAADKCKDGQCIGSILWSILSPAVGNADAAYECLTGRPLVGAWSVLIDLVDLYPSLKKMYKCNAAGFSTAYRVVQVQSSRDPNDLLGPVGAGAENWVNSTGPLGYMVRFENEAAATAPAAQVVVTCPLDRTKFDWNSLRFGTVTLADRRLTPPSRAARWTRTLDLRPRLNVLAQVSGWADPLNGLVGWSAVALDPVTQQLITDPSSGLLPANVLSPEGQGSVEFTINPVRSLPGGATLQNRASIVFDSNASMATNTWSVRLDSGAPVSRMTELQQAAQGDTTFLLKWSGSDDASGVAAYSIWMRRDDSPYSVWQPATSAAELEFTGQPGHVYYFQSTARDVAGNAEALKGAPEVAASTHRNLSSPDPIVSKIEAAALLPLPNPLWGKVEPELVLPGGGTGTLALFDVAGRLASEVSLSDLPAGRHRVSLATSNSLAPGVYMVHLRYAGKVVTRRAVYLGP